MAVSEERLCSLVEDEALRQVLGHWLAIRGDRDMPRRDELDPVAFPMALQHAWLYGMDDDGDFTCLLVGEHINDMLQLRAVTKPAREVIGPEYDRVVRTRWLYCLRHPAFMLGRVRPADGKPANRVACPLSDKDGTPRYVFGATIYLNREHRHRNQPLVAIEDMMFFHARTTESAAGPAS